MGMIENDFERLHAELEQSRVAVEDMEQRIAELTAANEELQRQLHEQTGARQAAERQLEDVRNRPPVIQRDESQEQMLRQQLSTTLEELQVMAEELELAQNALRQPAIAG